MTAIVVWHRDGRISLFSVSVTAVLHQLHLEPLEERRRISRLTFLYKILNEHLAVPMNQLDMVLCDKPVMSDDLLLNKDLIYLVVVLCDTWNRSDDNDTVSGIAILDTTAIPEVHYAISMFFWNCQSHTLVITEMCVSSSVSTVCNLKRLYSLLCILHEVYAPASVNITRSQAIARIADRTSSQHFWGHVTSSVTWPFDMSFPIDGPLD